MNREELLAQELLKLMRVDADNEWGPEIFVCRWCKCMLNFGKELHKPDCVAALLLNRPIKL